MQGGTHLGDVEHRPRDRDRSGRVRRAGERVERAHDDRLLLLGGVGEHRNDRDLDRWH